MIALRMRKEWLMEKSFEKGIGFTLLSAFCLALFGLFSKLGLVVPSFTLLLFLRFFVPLLLVTPFLIYLGTFKKIFPLKRVSHQWWRAISVLVSQYCFFYYLTRATLLDATLLLNTGPLYIPILSRIFYGHRIGKVTCLCLAISFCGVVLILKPTQGIFNLFSIVGLLAGVGQGFSQVLYGANVEKESNGENLFYLYFFTACLSFFPLIIGSRIDWGSFQGESVGWMVVWIVLMSVANIGSQGFRGFAYRHAKPSSLAPFLYTTTLFAGLFDWVIFGSIPTLLTIIGAGLVICGAFLKWFFRTRIYSP